MSLNQQVIAEFSPCTTPSAPQLRDLSIQTIRPSALRSMLDERIGDLPPSDVKKVAPYQFLPVVRVVRRKHHS